MGLAIIVPSVDFSACNLGKVSLKGNISPTSLTIVGPDSITEPTKFLCSFSPAITTNRNITWSIVSGSGYATIDSSTGVLTPIVGALHNEVRIRVTSLDASSIYADKVISVSYGMCYVERNALTSPINSKANINTGVAVTENDVIDCVYEVNEFPAATTTTKYYILWGTSYDGESNPMTRHMIQWTSNASALKNILQFGTQNGTGDNGFKFGSSTAIQFNTVYTEQLSSTSYSSTPALEKNDQGSHSTSNFYFSDKPLILFASSTNGLGTVGFTIRSFKVTRANNVIIDLVPCELLVDIPSTLAADSEQHYAGEYGMWDKVNNKFYGNASSEGAFTIS